ncbi:MAG TPA: dihydroorotase [Usitatibacter sp.]
MAETLSITRPDDWHAHLRDGEALKSVAPATARQFARAIVMPNLAPPVTTTRQAKAYRDRILEALPKGSTFEPLMTLYLTDETPATEIERAKEAGFVKAVKYYPAGATTNSASGVTDVRKCDAVLEAMQAAGMPLLIHGEVTDPEVDIFDRETVFLERQLAVIVKRYPTLKIVLEHITTHDAAAFVERAPANIGATITAHHLLLNRNSIFVGGIQPHHYCLPVVKRETHRRALVKAATSGNPKFFLGTDSAPHSRGSKESGCGHAGIYTAHAALELYAEAFEAVGALDKLEGFASHFGADFYGLPRNKGKVKLEKGEWQVPTEYPFGDKTVVPLRAGQTIGWHLAA